MNDNSLFNQRPASFRDKLDVFFHTRKPRFSLNKYSQISQTCFACGKQEGFKFQNIINDDLADEWSLDPSLRRSFDVRESTKCNNCGSSQRSNLHARTICRLLAPSCKSLADAVINPSFGKLAIAEINACGALHKILQAHPQLAYSEYKPSDKSVKHESLDKLSYNSDTFDIVLTSETLEHVPDWGKAVDEIRRVLKPGGLHIFTVPTILTRQTRTRAVGMADGAIENILKPSYHGYGRGVSSDYIVFNEFGSDFRAALDKHGFQTKIYYRNALYLSDPNFVFVSVKV